MTAAHTFPKGTVSSHLTTSPKVRLEGGEASRRFAVLAGVLAALVLAVVASIRLPAQGLEYDELHQAPAAFAYVGRDPVMFARLKIGGIPVLNTSYSGAIKSALYGLYMRVTGAGFSVVSWRLTGIILAASGLVIFCLISRRAWTRSGLSTFLVLLVSDGTLILLTRFDWGAVALALFCRLLIIAVYLRGTATGAIGLAGMFGLGVLRGIAIFEKLVAVVLVIPVVLLIRSGWRPLAARQWAAAVAGALLGGMPLLVANGYSYLHTGTLISFSDLTPLRQPPRVPLIRFVGEYLGLGQAVRARVFMLGANLKEELLDYRRLAAAEAIIVAALLLMIWLAWRHSGRNSPALRAAGGLAMAYVSVAIGLALMPRSTLMHH